MRLIAVCLAITAAVAVCAQNVGIVGPAMRGGIGMLSNPAVQRELGITPEQMNTLAQADREIRQQAMLAMQSADNTPESRMRIRDAIAEEMDAAMMRVLSQPQLLRLRQIEIQAQGIMAILAPDVQRELGMSEEQVRRAGEVWRRHMQLMTAAFEKARSGEAAMPLQDRKAMQKKLETDLAAILTPAQTERFKQLGGKPFQFETTKPAAETKPKTSPDSAPVQPSENQ